MVEMRSGYLLAAGCLAAKAALGVEAIYAGNGYGQVIEVNAVDGHRELVSGPVFPASPFGQPAVHPVTGDFHVYDFHNKRLARFDPDGDAWETLVENGPDVSNLGVADLMFDADGTLYLGGPLHLYRYEEGTASFTTVSGLGTGTGPWTSYWNFFALAPGGTMYFSAESSETVPVSHPIVAIDLSTGNRTTVSDSNTGSGPGAAYAPIALDPDGELFLASAVLMRIDRTNGDRTLVSGVYQGAPDVGSGPAMAGSAGAAADATYVYTVSQDLSMGVGSPYRIMRIHQTTGVREIISTEGTGTGPSLGVAHKLVLDDGVLYTISDYDSILAIDVATGNRTLVAGPEMRGAGVELSSAMPFATAAGELFAFDSAASRLVAIDPETGDRTVASEFGVVGTGPMPFGIDDMVLHGDGDLYGLQSDSAIMRVDLATGDRTMVSTNSAPAGTPSFDASADHRLVSGPDGMLYLFQGQYAFFNPVFNTFGYSNPTPLIAIDPSTGVRTTVTSVAGEVQFVGGAVFDSTGTIRFCNSPRVNMLFPSPYNVVGTGGIKLVTLGPPVTIAPSWGMTEGHAVMAGGDRIVSVMDAEIVEARLDDVAQLRRLLSPEDQYLPTTGARLAFGGEAVLTDDASSNSVTVGFTGPMRFGKLGVLLLLDNVTTAGTIVVQPVYPFQHPPNLPEGLAAYWAISGLADGTFEALITLPFTEALLAFAEANAAELSIYVSRDGGLTWDEVPSTVDEDEGTITTDVAQTEFSLWAIAPAGESRTDGWRLY